MAGFSNIVKIYDDALIHYDALEGILEPVLNVQGTWDPSYGHVTRGLLLKRVAGVTVQGVANVTVERPMVLGLITAVNGPIVTLARGSAAGSGLIGKVLTKVVTGGAVTALVPTVVSVLDTEGATESRSIYAINITFSTATGLPVVGDFLGCEGLVDADVADGVSYESHNRDQDPSVAVTVRAVFKAASVVGNAAIFTKFITRARVRDDLLFLQAY